MPGSEVPVIGGRSAAWRPVAAAVAASALALTGAVVALQAGGYPPAAVDLRLGQAWLASAKVGQVALVDGATGDVAARLPVAGADAVLALAQTGPDALVADRRTGAVLRVAGDTQQVSRPAHPLPGAGSGLAVFAGASPAGAGKLRANRPAVAFAVDARQGSAVAMDPRTLRALGRPVSVAASLDARATLVDNAGSLWAVDTATGDLVWLTAGHKHVVRGFASAGVSPMVLVDGRPAAVDPRSRLVSLLDPADGRVTGRSCLDLRPEEPFAVGGAGDDPLVFAAAPDRGVLLVADLGHGDCSRVITLDSAGGRLGVPVETGGRVFVPNFTTGQVHVIALAANRVIASPRVLPAGLQSFELLPRDGAVFYNDPGSERAGVLRLDGSQLRIRKYDPRRPYGDENRDPGGRTITPSNPASMPSTSSSAGQSALRVRVSERPAIAGRPVALAVSADSELVGANWSFGDGTATGDGLQVAHTWRRSGQYRVTVRARTADGRLLFGGLTMPVLDQRGTPTRSPATTAAPSTSNRPTSTGTTTARPTTTSTSSDPSRRPPTAELTVDDWFAAEPIPVTVRGEADQGEIVEYRIDWGDGEVDESATPTGLTHTYRLTGDYTVTLEVTDDAGLTGVDRADITVAVPQVLDGNRITIEQTFRAHLDTDDAHDIWFEAVTATERYISSYNDTRLARVSGSAYNDCAGAQLGPAGIPIQDLQVGSVVCVRTTGGALSRLTIVQLPGPSPGELTLDVTTWIG